ncbi:MAG: metallophosphoesterase [Chitinophagaceae bacterium]|nr:metallophosphoesterase [Chitinophagaceae bacterium]
MKRVSFVICLCMFSQLLSYAQGDTIQARVILIGDAGELTPSGHQPVVDGARNFIKIDDKTTILYLGDNLYNKGLPDDASPNYKLAKAPLDTEITIAKGTKAKVIFIPGNHDWEDGGRGGWDAIVRQQYYVNGLGDKNIMFYPHDGCPGPEEIQLSGDVVLVVMDSQWWVHLYDKPGIESDCPYKTQAEVLSQLDDILTRNAKKLVLFACHHTFRSYGIHGGYFTLKQHIFPFTDVIKKAYIPLPIIGSIYPITRSVFGTSEDLKHPLYASMISDIEHVVKGHPNVIYVAGHEHTLQLIKDSSYNYIVSGSGSKSTRVSKSKKTVYASPKNGFATLEISKNKNVNVSFYIVDSNTVKQDFTKNILNFTSPVDPKVDTPSTREVEYAFKDSAVISASDKYKNPSKFKKFFLGENYRKEWSTPVSMKVFNIRKEQGGFKIISLGGGKQTKSLRLKDNKGNEWVLRSIDKEVEKELPENLQNTVAKRIVQDLTSASHPYGALPVPVLSDAAGVIAATPMLFYVPDDPVLGPYRKIFGNTVCMLEKRDPTLDESNTRSTAKIINKIIDNNDHHIDQEAVLRARLLDNILGDWDRHFDQWKWGTTDTGIGKLYYPVPRDRDQVFFNSDGVLSKYIVNNHLRYLQGFKNNYPSIKWFNWEERDFDRLFLNNLDEDKWKNIISTFQHNITDAVIAASVKKLPGEIYALDAGTISAKLKSRRDLLMSEGLKYYRFISKEVNVVGSNDAEYFKVKKSGNGLQVIVYKNEAGIDTSDVLYKRIFVPKQTKEIRLYGLNGNDKFEVDDDVNSKIKLRIIGGKGNDTFNIKGHVPNQIYDLSTEKNGVINSNRSKIHFSASPAITEYKTTGYNYNKFSFPQVNLGYNAEDKVLVGVGFTSTTYGFRKEPYATYQKFQTLYAINNNAYQINYQGVFNSVFYNKDLLINAQMINPTLNNFYGLGNNTKKAPGTNLEFYRARYKLIQADVLLRKRFNDIVSFSFGPSFFHYSAKYKDNQSKILGNPSLVGLDSANIYTDKHYAGGKASMDIS